MTTKTRNTSGLILLAGTAVYAAGAALPLVHAHAAVCIAVRCLGLFCFAFYAAHKRSLTPLIFLGMLAGAELGLDYPTLAVQMRVFSDIFLRLIKTIVAPLILGTLITGIAGHGDLKGVGRIAIKALIYFEVMTAFALLVGLVAINITHAGVGLVVPVEATHGSVSVLPVDLHWQDFLHIYFPKTSQSPSQRDRFFRLRFSR